MKTKILLLTLITFVFAPQVQGQNRTVVNATSSEISDNLDLRVVASLFGDSKNLEDFERQLNDPKLQISNLDLNNDNQVDYLRVIESVENRTHVVIIQSVLDRDIYQDVATIEVEKDNYNQVHIQVVGNAYMYGQNYIYEPVYYTTPVIFASFWVSNYRPYYSSWSWNYYPRYYVAWNPYPIFRYRNNVNYCLNTYYGYNNYNYVNHRRSVFAVNIYNSRRSNGYERQYPNYSFERRNSNIVNRYELDQRRTTRTAGNYHNRIAPQRNYSSNRTESSRTEPQRNYSSNKPETPRVDNQQRKDPERNYSSNRSETSRATNQQRTESKRNYSSNRSESPRASNSQRLESKNDNSTSRNSSSREGNNPSRSSNRRS